MTFSNAFYWKLFNVKPNVTEICGLVYYWQNASIGSDNGLAPNMRQAFIWTNVGMLYWRINASLGLIDLKVLTYCTKLHELQSVTLFCNMRMFRTIALLWDCYHPICWHSAFSQILYNDQSTRDKKLSCFVNLLCVSAGLKPPGTPLQSATAG